MIDFIKKILGYLSSNFSLRSDNKTNNSKIKGDGNTLNQANGNLTQNNNNNYNYFIPLFCYADLTNIHQKGFKDIANTFIQEFPNEINGINLWNILSNYSNCQSLAFAVNQIATYPNDVERREMLRRLLLEKFKNNVNGDMLYHQAILEMEKLTAKELRILAVMSFIMTLIRYLSEQTMVRYKDSIISLIREIGVIKKVDMEKLRCQGLVYSLFPKRYDDRGLDCLKNVDVEMYDYCLQYVKRNEFICEYQLLPIGCLLSKTLFSVVYGFDYEDICREDVLPLKKVDLEVGNLNADGNVVAGCAVTFGGGH